MEIRTVFHLREIFLPFLPTKQVLHPSLKLLRLPVTREVQDEVFSGLTTITYGRKAMGCVMWDVECICDEGCEEISDQWAIHCEKNGFSNPEIVKFTTDPEYLGRQRKVSKGQPTRSVSLPKANISEASRALSYSTLSDTQSRIRGRRFVNTSLLIRKTSLLKRRSSLH